MLYRIVNLYKIFEQGFKYRKWAAANKPLPPPHFVKEQVIRRYAYRFGIRTLVETGTYRGLMVKAMKDLFARIYTIELDKTLHAEAVEQFRPWPHIRLLQGDSAAMLAKTLDEITEPCIFWLDAHYSGGVTARADKDTPVVEELKAIVRHPQRNHVVLIDDARCFNGEDDYPTYEALVKLLEPDLSAWEVRNEDDVIRLYRRAMNG